MTYDYPGRTEIDETETEIRAPGGRVIWNPLNGTSDCIKLNGRTILLHPFTRSVGEDELARQIIWTLFLEQALDAGQEMTPDKLFHALGRQFGHAVPILCANEFLDVLEYVTSTATMLPNLVQSETNVNGERVYWLNILDKSDDAPPPEPPVEEVEKCAEPCADIPMLRLLLALAAHKTAVKETRHVGKLNELFALQTLELVERVPQGSDTMISLTERGRVYAEALLSLPLPIPAGWKMPDK